MNLFQMKNYKLEISPEAYALTPFKKIWDRDKTKYKEKAIAELAYIYYMVDYKSDFQSIIDEKDRTREVLSVIEGLPNEWKEDKIIEKAKEFYKDRSKSIASEALEYQRANIYKLISKIGNFMDSDDANDVQKAANMSSKVNQFIKDIDELEKIVKGQQEIHNTRHKGSQEKSMMEDD